jgi:hypothetical protein
MFVTPSIRCHSQPFLRAMIFAQFFGLYFPICLTILHMPIPTVFSPSFLTWGFHSHFVEIRYTIGGPIGRNVVCFSSPSCSSPYSTNPPYLCFLFLGRWYTYSRSHIKCGFCIFTIIKRVINIRFVNVANEVCSLVSSWVRPLYIISFWLFYSRRIFVFWVYQWDPHHLLSHLWLRLSMKILGWYLVSLCL